MERAGVEIDAIMPIQEGVSEDIIDRGVWIRWQDRAKPDSGRASLGR